MIDGFPEGPTWEKPCEWTQAESSCGISFPIVEAMKLKLLVFLHKIYILHLKKGFSKEIKQTDNMDLNLISIFTDAYKAKDTKQLISQIYKKTTKLQESFHSPG